MKKLLFITALLAFAANIQSQTYIPLLDENNTWNVVAAGFMYEPYYDTVYQTITYTVEGDTVINSQDYKIILASLQEVPTDWGLNCFMKEDDDGKVWMKSTTINQEYLAYDFSLDQGETALIGPYSGLTAVVDSVTSVNLGGPRKKIWVHYEEMPDVIETWTEGIGSSRGLVWSGEPIVGGFYELLCFSQNDELVYMDPDYLSCYIYTVGIDDQDAGRFVVFPNPATGYLKINNINNLDIKSISLSGITGKTLCDFNPESDIIDLSTFKPGIYFLRIVHQGGFITRKIIIE